MAQLKTSSHCAVAPLSTKKCLQRPPEFAIRQVTNNSHDLRQDLKPCLLMLLCILAKYEMTKITTIYLVTITFRFSETVKRKLLLHITWSVQTILLTLYVGQETYQIECTQLMEDIRMF